MRKKRAMKLIYWTAENLNDSKCYSIREKTRKAVIAKLAENITTEYGPVRKVIIEYADAFDLMKECTGEGGLYEGRSD